MIFSPRTLQAKLLVSVFLIVSAMVLSLTALVICVEKGRSEQKELDRIAYATEAMKRRLGHLMYGRNLRYLTISMNSAKTSDQSMLYYAVTGVDGKVLVSDREDRIGRAFDASRNRLADAPLYRKDASEGNGVFLIYLADYVPEGTGSLPETVFEGVHDILYMGEFMGRLWVGYSRQAMNRHLLMLTAGMLGTGGLTLTVLLLSIYAVIRTHMGPVESFIREIACLDLSPEGQGLKECLAGVPLERQRGETLDVHQLKQAFEHLLNQFSQACSQLEEHKSNLERMVAERTADLNLSNTRLSREIQERKEIEARLLTVQKLEAISTLAGGIAHEFNNLFMAITGYATLIQKRAGTDATVVEKAEKIRQLVETGSQSVQQLLGFARGGKYAPGPLNLNAVIRGSLIILTHSRKDILVNASYQGGLWTVLADRSQMEQVVMNLLLNASEAMPGRGSIEIFTENQVLDGFQVSLSKRVSGRFICLAIQDRGVGIPAENLPRIFDPFFTTKEVGSGMGLASVFGIVENHGGFITADSRPGEGSLFKVFLPALSKS